jgi:hypothetical protein
VNTVDRILGESDDEDDYEDTLEPSEVYFHIKDGVDAPSPELEAIIAQDGLYSYLYAKNVLKARFQQGEPAIIKDSENPFIRELADEYGKFLSTVDVQGYLDFMLSNNLDIRFDV